MKAKPHPQYFCPDAPLPATLEADWQAFFDNEHRREAGHDCYQEIFDHNVLFPLQRSRELAAMMRIARSILPKTVMEIGADKGGSFYHWIKSLPSVRRAIACEIRGTPYDQLFTDAFPLHDLLFLPQPSRMPETLEDVQAFLGDDLIDCLFLDGDKCFFLEDFLAYLPLMRNGGIVFMHDVYLTPSCEAPPCHVFAEIGRDYTTKLILDTTEGREAAAREAKGLPIVNAYDGFLRVWKETSCGVGVIYV